MKLARSNLRIAVGWRGMTAPLGHSRRNVLSVISDEDGHQDLRTKRTDRR